MVPELFAGCRRIISIRGQISICIYGKVNIDVNLIVETIFTGSHHVKIVDPGKRVCFTVGRCGRHTLRSTNGIINCASIFARYFAPLWLNMCFGYSSILIVNLKIM
jgi:hypothetical protein